MGYQYVDFYGKTQKFVHYIAMSAIEGCPLSGVLVYITKDKCVLCYSHYQNTAYAYSVLLSATALRMYHLLEKRHATKPKRW